MHHIQLLEETVPPVRRKLFNSISQAYLYFVMAKNHVIAATNGYFFFQSFTVPSFGKQTYQNLYRTISRPVLLWLIFFFNALNFQFH